MEIRTDFNNKEEWNKFIIDNILPASWLQSWDWGEFNEQILNNKIIRWTLHDDNELKMVGMAIAKELPLSKKFWYCPRGVVWAQDYMDKRATGYGEIFKRVDKDLNNEIFVRILPPYERKDHLIGFAKTMGMTRPRILLRSEEPESTTVLDLEKSEEKLLKNMHQKTRYNIKLAEKKGVKIRQTTKDSLDNDLDIFYNLSKQTAERNKIKIYGKEYYKKFVDFFSDRDDFQIKMYMAEKDNKPLVATMVLYFGTTATYLHGASDDNYRNIMPSYLTQWEAIKQAKQDGMRVYDFWGISETKKEWSGITRFKLGFGGKIINYMGSWDYIINKKWYFTFIVLRFIKKITRK